MNKHLLISVLFFFFFSFIFSQKINKLENGEWNGYLILSETDSLNFKIQLEGKKNKLFIIKNDEEKIALVNLKKIKDSFQLDFPNFHSFIRFKILNKKELSGYWCNLNKGANYTIPFYSKKESSNPSINSTINLTGNWKTIFSPNTKDQEYAIGKFVQQNSYIKGTFLSETGDYRFLAGEVNKAHFTLNCFDGSHAFYFKGVYRNDSILALFRSGKHYKTDWVATKDANFSLRNPDSITYVNKKEALHFKVKDLKGKEYVYPNETIQGKAHIIQIMGTWCPNCLDETRFLKEMFDKYNKDGLEIISVAYETPDNLFDQIEKVNMLKERLKLEYTFLIGGRANKALASEQFSVLNEIISFPTAIFINKNGDIEKIHTGFNGPGTGEVYVKFKLETEDLIKKLVH